MHAKVAHRSAKREGGPPRDERATVGKPTFACANARFVAFGCLSSVRPIVGPIHQPTEARSGRVQIAVRGNVVPVPECRRPARGQGACVSPGCLIWDVSTLRSYDTVNGVSAAGGSLDGAVPMIVGGMLFVN